MRSASARSASIAAFLLLAANPSSSARDLTGLKGLKSVRLKMDIDRSIEAVERGILENVATEAGPKLKQAGIVVVREESSTSPEAPLLHFEVVVRCDSDSSCGYQVSLSLLQQAQLVRDQSLTITAITWRDSYTGSVRKADLATVPDLLAVDAGTLLLKFIDDYHAENKR